MIKVFIDLLSFLRTTFPLLFCVAVFALLFILLAKSIKKYYYVYYTLFAIPFLMVVGPSILRMCGVEMTFSFTRIPVLGEILRDYIHMASLGHPLLIIIMYVGALDMKNLYVKRLMSIRKEISIISGFPVLTHSWIRTLNGFPDALKYFTDHAEFMNNPRVTSALGAGITNTVLVLGIVMLVLFLILWITSFDAVHKRLGGRKWKQIQKWSYVLYALLFIHAIGLQVGRMVSNSAGNANANERNRTEMVSDTKQSEQPTQTGERGGGERGGGRGRMPTKGLTDIVIGQNVKQAISVSSLLLIYGSYLFLRVRKARKKAAKKNVAA